MTDALASREELHEYFRIQFVKNEETKKQLKYVEKLLDQALNSIDDSQNIHELIFNNKKIIRL
jgi:hypothetical protein